MLYSFLHKTLWGLPIEQIWKQIRSMGFRNVVFNSLADVITRLCDTINILTNDLVKHIALREWIEKRFLYQFSAKSLI